jgi:SAM-dependent methyltransferase
MELISCKLCGSNEYRTKLVGRDLSLHLEGTFDIVECVECGLVYLNPRPTRQEVEALYPFESYDQYIPALAEVGSWFRRLDWGYGLSKRARKVARWKKAGRLLDVGCATGSFLESMQRHGDWQVCGVELNPHAVQYVREHLGIPVHQGMLEEVGLPDDSFDVVTMWHVLEHVFDPVSTLHEVARILKPGGIFLYHVPQLDSFDARLFGGYWIGYEIPRHTFIWSQKTLKKLMALTGFRIVEMCSFYGSYSAWASSIRFWLRDKLGREGLRELLEKILFSMPMRLAFAPYFVISDRLAKSSSLTVVCTPIQQT